MKTLKKLLPVALSIMLVLVGKEYAGAGEKKAFDPVCSCALNSYSGEQEGAVEEFRFDGRTLSFQYGQKSFRFAVDKLEIDTRDGRNIKGADFYSGTGGNLICNAVSYNGKVCVQVIDKTESMYGRRNDSRNNFTVLSGAGLKEDISAMSAELASQNKEIENRRKASPRSGLHVYVSGLTVPFLISGGSAEGWCNATIRESSQYQITGMSYAVTYNWPSDGVSLWYDYRNSVEAYHSPAWPASSLTQVNGSWTVNSSTGAFQAEATVSALVQGSPLMWSLYDTSYMDGTHE